MKKLLFIFLIALISAPSFANDKDNGGDECERRIQNIRNDIQDWIDRGGSQHLDMHNLTTHEDYIDLMSDAMKDTSISCTTKPVYIGRAEKTCKNTKDKYQNPLLICNAERFNSLDPDRQYTLIHHEYAGIAGFEVNKGNENSVYLISNQISGFLEFQMVKKLAVRSNEPMQQVNDYSEPVTTSWFSGLEVEAKYVGVANLTSDEKVQNRDHAQLAAKSKVYSVCKQFYQGQRCSKFLHFIPFSVNLETNGKKTKIRNLSIAILELGFQEQNTMEGIGGGCAVKIGEFTYQEYIEGFGKNAKVSANLNCRIIANALKSGNLKILFQPSFDLGASKTWDSKMLPELENGKSTGVGAFWAFKATGGIKIFDRVSILGNAGIESSGLYKKLPTKESFVLNKYNYGAEIGIDLGNNLYLFANWTRDIFSVDRGTRTVETHQNLTTGKTYDVEKYKSKETSKSSDYFGVGLRGSFDFL